MLLNEWGYNRTNLIYSLFELESGSFIGKIDEAKAVILAMWGKHKLPAQIRNGFTFEKPQLGLNDIIGMSEEYAIFYNDKREGLLDALAPDVTSRDIWNRTLGEYMSTGMTAPLEFVALAPSEMLTTHNDANSAVSYGRDGSKPFTVSQAAHGYAHNYAFNIVNDRLGKLYIEAGLPKQKVRAEASYKKARSYSGSLKGEWASLLEQHVKQDEQGNYIGYELERNPEFISFIDEFANKFSKLTKLEKAHATMLFLNGDITNIPPSSKSPAEPSTLDSSVLGLYYKAYNHAIESNMLDSNKRDTFKAKNLIEALCK